MITPETVSAGFKYFKMKNLKGRPNINTTAEYQDMLNVWSESLDDIEPHIFIKACKMISDESTFYPAFAEVRSRCDELMTGKTENSAVVWNKIKSQMIAVHGPYSNLEDRESLFKNIACPIIREAAKSFDWRQYGQSNKSQELFYQRDFEKIYNAVAENQKFQKTADRVSIGMGDEVKSLVNDIAQKIAG